MMLRFLKLTVMVAVLLLCSAKAQAQPGEPLGTGTISGTVTANGRPLVGTTITLLQTRGRAILRERPTTRVKTDESGKYIFSKIAAGSYQIGLWSPLYAPTEDTISRHLAKQILLEDGENVTDVDLSLVRGGAVTGKITDIEGRPLVDKHVLLIQVDAQNRPALSYRYLRSQLDSDDRGIYRVYGVPPGRYLVSAGDDKGKYSRTFYPGVTDYKQAAVIEVTDGGETNGIDIKFNPPFKTYAITGRAVDAETGEPVAKVMIFKEPYGPGGGQSGFYPISTNGEFQLEGLKAGKYGLTAGGGPGGAAISYGYSEEILVDVLDKDVTGVEIRVKRGVSLSGVAVIEGVSDQSVLSNLSRQRIEAVMRDEGEGPAMVAMSIDQNGRYRAEGLRPGKWTLSHIPGGGGLMLLRIERDGVPITNEIEIRRGEQVTGLRMTFGMGSGVIRGKVAVTGGTLPEGTSFYVVPHRIGIPRHESWTGLGQADARSFFYSRRPSTGAI
jgi:protocatechuate 3,4-dioxygenase beta subunit